MLQYDLETRMPKMLDRATTEELFQDGLGDITEQVRMLERQKAGGADGEEEKDSGSSEIRFEDLAGSAAQ